jgi:hypothetical protein
VPEDADSPRFRTNIGSVHYAPEKSAIIWKIKQFGGGKEFLMRAELGLPSVKGDDEHGGGMTGGFGGSMGGTGQGKAKRPINVKFEIPYFTTSGIQVRYLKITEPKVCPVDSAPRWRSNADLTSCCSCNTPPFLGFDTLHSLAISLSVCPMYNDFKRRVSSNRHFSFFSVLDQAVGWQVEPVSQCTAAAPSIMISSELFSFTSLWSSRGQTTFKPI